MLLRKEIRWDPKTGAPRVWTIRTGNPAPSPKK